MNVKAQDTQMRYTQTRKGAVKLESQRMNVVHGQKTDNLGRGILRTCEL